MIQIAILGHGVVGSGVVEVLERNQDYIVKNVQQNIFVKRILVLRDFDVPYRDRFTNEYADILDDDEISIIVEAMGGLTPAYDYVKAALRRKKSVVTSNKELVAQKGAELLALAKQNNVNFHFEASVGGGIPIIRPLYSCLAANQIHEIAGILNGTTNFILTKMIDDKMSFEDALTLAQKLGFAEKNPTADVDGHDTCRKICILASLAYGKQIYPDAVSTQGIGRVTLEDIEYASSYDCVIKLVGRAKRMDCDDKIWCTVCPSLITKKSQLSSIDNEFNGILVRGNATGDVLFYGKGAGKFPTASAVIADIIDAAKASATNESLSWVDDGVNHVLDDKKIACRYYLRLTACENSAARTRIGEMFGSVIYLSRKDQPKNEIAVIVKPMEQEKLTQMVQQLASENIQLIHKLHLFEM